MTQLKYKNRQVVLNKILQFQVAYGGVNCFTAFWRRTLLTAFNWPADRRSHQYHYNDEPRDVSPSLHASLPLSLSKSKGLQKTFR